MTEPPRAPHPGLDARRLALLLALLACEPGGAAATSAASDGASDSSATATTTSATAPGGESTTSNQDPSETSAAVSSGTAAGSGTGSTEDTAATAATATADTADTADTPPPPSGAFYFTDITESAGLAVKQGEFKSPPHCLVDAVALQMPGHFCTGEWQTGGAAAGDYDGDGRVDLYVARIYGEGALYRNLGGGAFVDRAAEAGLALGIHAAGAAWADIDNDGDLDLYVTAVGDVRHYLFINDGAGHFTEEAIARGAALLGPDQHVGTTPAFGDYDLDGYVDLFVGEYRTHLSLGDGPSYNRLLRNRGADAPGVFEDMTKEAGVILDEVWSVIDDPYPIAGALALTPAFVDLDGDDYPELAIAADFKTSRLFWNQGDGTFVDGTLAAGVGSDENGMGAAFGDFDGDGDLDWFVTSISGAGSKTGNRLYRYDGDRAFSDATDLAGVRDGHWGWGAAFADLDNDADLDLVMTNGWNFTNFLLDPMRLWLNPGGGAGMIEASADLGVTDTRMGRALLTLDLDGDGDLDLYNANFAQTPALYRNDADLGHRWLRVRAVGTQSESSGRGAVVHVRPAEGAPELLRVIGEPTYLGHGELVAHFGLGPGEGPIAEVRVRWPASGAEVVLTEVAPNALLVVAEP